MTSARTVAILFTDLVGSTELWSRNGNAMATALAMHDALAERCFAEARTVRHTGDGSMAVFDSVDLAVAAATDLMDSMRSTSWPTDEPLGLRMGVHVGAAQERDGNWFGTAVNRAARVADAANRGQLLLSQAAELSARDLVSGHASVDVGRARLKGLDRDETLFHVLGPAFVEAMPPRVRLVNASRPSAAQSLLGRDELVATTVALLEEHPVVSLTGLGGVGKTQLALAVAEAFGVRTAFVDLAPVDAGQVVEAFGDALGVAVDQSGHLPAVVAASVGYDLIIVDNCEHVLDEVAAAVSGIVAANADLALLLTSREAVGMAGERVLRVPSLPLADAVELFVARAGASGASVEVDDPAIEEICRQLDGLPLAIELAAGRTALLAPTQIVDRLDQRFRLLAGGRRGADRQQTLESVMDWSYDLLDPTEQAALRAASVFVGGFDLEAFAAVARLDEFDALDVLASLAAKSLVVSQPSADGSRYTVLETVRIYGLGKAREAGDADGLSDAHAAYFRDLPGPTVEWQVSFSMWGTYLLARGSRPDEGNVRAALRWFDETGDLRSVGLLAAGAMIAHQVFLSDSDGRYFERDDVADAMEGRERELYLVTSTFAANIRGDWAAQVELATRVRTESDDPVMRAVATGLIVLVAPFFEGYDTPALIEEAVAELGGTRPDIVRDLRSREFDRQLGAGNPEPAIDTLAAQAAVGDFVATVDLVKALVMLGRFEEAVARVDEWPGTWGSQRELWRNLVQAHAAAETDAPAAIGHLMASEAVLHQYYDALVEAELLLVAAAIALGSGDPAHASRLLAATGANFRTPGGYGIYAVLRDRVKARLPREEIQRIRAEAADTSAHEVFRAEVARLRAVLADGQTGDATA